jgi:hypothetical protein
LPRKGEKAQHVWGAATLPGAGVKARRIKKAAPRTSCAALKRQKSSSENKLCRPKVAKKGASSESVKKSELFRAQKGGDFNAKKCSF